MKKPKRQKALVERGLPIFTSDGRRATSDGFTRDERRATSNGFKVTARKVIFSKGPIHLVDCDVRLPDGLCISRQIIEHPGAVVIIPKVGPDKFLLIRQFRFAARQYLWEWPAGGIEKGEKLADSARRELAEETGFWPKKLASLFSFYPTPGISSEVMYLFLAENLIARKALGDEDERIEVHEFTLEQIDHMIRQEKILDAKTLLGFYYLKQCG